MAGIKKIKRNLRLFYAKFEKKNAQKIVFSSGQNIDINTIFQNQNLQKMSSDQ